MLEGIVFETFGKNTSIGQAMAKHVKRVQIALLAETDSNWKVRRSYVNPRDFRP